MKQNKQEQILQQQITELVLNLTDGYCDLTKYSFNDESFARFQFFIEKESKLKHQKDIEKIEGMKKKIDEFTSQFPVRTTFNTPYKIKASKQYAYNQAIDDVLNTLKEE